MGLPVIQETDENSILFPTRNNQSNAIWQDQMDLDDVMALIESQTHTEGKTFMRQEQSLSRTSNMDRQLLRQKLVKKSQ